MNLSNSKFFFCKHRMKSCRPLLSRLGRRFAILTQSLLNDSRSTRCMCLGREECAAQGTRWISKRRKSHGSKPAGCPTMALACLAMSAAVGLQSRSATSAATMDATGTFVPNAPCSRTLRSVSNYRTAARRDSGKYSDVRRK